MRSTICGRLLLAGACLIFGRNLWGQQDGAESPELPKLEVAVLYNSLLTNVVRANRFWMQGGSAELGANLIHGFGFAAEVTGTHTGSIGTSGVPLSLVSVTCGPRYRWHAGPRSSVYGEAMIGEADGFDSLFPATSGSLTSSNSLAVQVGGGADFHLSKRFALRIDAAWMRTQLPNATDNVQNTLRLSGGIAIRFGR